MRNLKEYPITTTEIMRTVDHYTMVSSHDDGVGDIECIIMQGIREYLKREQGIVLDIAKEINKNV